jgi:hypothetical protein
MQLKQLTATAMVAATFSVSVFGSAGSPVQAESCEPREHGVIACQAGAKFVSHPRPDLLIRDWRVIPDVTPSDSRNNVAEGEPYRLCYTVANIGGANAGPFKVEGGGLGIGFNPSNTHAGLAAGDTAVGCLAYPNTPAPGVYFLAVEADATHIVNESNEANNARVEPIQVMP